MLGKQVWRFEVQNSVVVEQKGARERQKSVLHVHVCFLLIRFISLEAIFIACRPRLALHDLLFWFTRIINQSFAFSPG